MTSGRRSAGRGSTTRKVNSSTARCSSSRGSRTLRLIEQFCELRASPSSVVDRSSRP